MNKDSYGFDEIKLGDFSIDLNGETDDIFIIAARFEERGTAVVSINVKMLLYIIMEIIVIIAII